MSRSLPKGTEPWKTFHIRVATVRGRAEVYASVDLTAVTGIVGSIYPRPRPIWQGVIGVRAAGEEVSPEDCAVWAEEALRKAFPRLF